MWYIQPHSTASLKPSEGASHRMRAGRGLKPGLSGLVICARLGCLTSFWVPGVRRLAPALRCTGVQLRFQWKRPLLEGCCGCDAAAYRRSELIGARECAKAATLLVLAHAKLKAVINEAGHMHIVHMPCKVYRRQQVSQGGKESSSLLAV